MIRLLGAIVIGTTIACECEPDEFGDELVLVVPITASLSDTVIAVGDTVFWQADFSKEVTVRGSTLPVKLENYPFFTSFDLIELSDAEVLDFNRPVDVLELVGEVVTISQDQTVYLLKFRETDDRYAIAFGIIFKEPGLYSAGFSNVLQSEDIDHPVAYKCNDSRRTSLYNEYSNPATSRQVYEALYLSSPNRILQELTTYERYTATGSISFRVIP